MHLHVRGFSAATILVFTIASPSQAPGYEAFGGHSVNADDVKNRPAIVVVDQKASPSSAQGARRRHEQQLFGVTVDALRERWRATGFKIGRVASIRPVDYKSSRRNKIAVSDRRRLGDVSQF